MANLQQEWNDLNRADQHLAEGEQRIAEQIALIEWLAKRGYDTAVAHDLLRLLEQTLTTWREHRQIIVETIARHERSQTQPLKQADPGPVSP